MKIAVCLCYLLFLSVLIPSANGQPGNKSKVIQMIDYDLASPDKIYDLPASLYEISGISVVDATTIACVQDENGIIFLHDLNKNETYRYIVFGGLGDYEDLAVVDNAIFVLRSDELLIQVMNFRSDKFKTEAFPAHIPGKDAEGLCYDRQKNLLLITPKQIPEDNPDFKGKRFIYAFDLNTKKIIKGPLIKLDIHAIEKYAKDNSIKTPMKKTGDGKEKPDIKLRISAIGIHPVTKRLFVLSGPERLLFVFDMTGRVEYIEKLDKDLFPQPEGITFFSNGDMLISNEGNKGPATMLRFSFKPASGYIK